MIYEITWSKNADQSFANILKYLTENFGLLSAEKFRDKVFNVLYFLSKYPEIGKMDPQNYGIRGYLIVKQITLFYRIRGN